MANFIKSSTDTYHLCSSGTRSDLLFHNRSEFIDGMNIIASAINATGLELLAFCLMDNHFHFILCADTEEEIKTFGTKVSQLYQRRNGTSLERTVKESIRWWYATLDSEEYVKTAIAYTLKNPTNAFYPKKSLSYPWSSGNLYFRDEMELETLFRVYQRIGEMKATKVRSLLKTQHHFPENWYMTDYGFIWPGSYVNWQRVETLFGGPKSFQYYISATKKEQMEGLLENQRRVCISDLEIRDAAKSLCAELYGCNRIGEVNLQGRCEIARRLKLKFGCSSKQIDRILHLAHK